MILYNYASQSSLSNLRTFTNTKTHTKLESTTNISTKNFQLKNQSRCFLHVTTIILKHQFHTIMYHSTYQYANNSQHHHTIYQFNILYLKNT